MKQLLILLLLSCFTLNAKEWTLQDVLDYSLKNSPRIQNSKLSIDDARQLSAIARAEFDMRITLNSSAKTDGNADNNAFRLVQPLPAGFDVSVTGNHNRDGDDNDTTDLSIAITKQILGGGSLDSSLKEIRNAHTNELISLNNFKSLERDLVRDLMLNFYRIIRTRKSLEISERRLETSKKNLEMAIARDDPLDISSAKIRVPQDKISVIAARATVKNELDAMQVLMGLAPTSDFDIKTNFEFSLAEPNSAEDIKYAQQNSEDFLNIELDRIKIKREVEDRTEKKLPDVSLFARHRLENDSSEDINLAGEEDTTLGVNFTWTFGSRAEIAQLAIAKNNLQENLLDYRILYNDRLRSLRRLERLMAELNTSIDVQIQEIEFNNEQVELYKDRWESGKMAILEYLRSQDRLENSRIQLINLQTNYMENLQNYLYDSGMTYSPNLTLKQK